MSQISSIRMDGGKLQRSGDGIIMIKKSRGCIPIGLMIGAVGSTLLAAFFAIRSIPMLLDPATDISLWDVISIFGLAAFLGFVTYFLFRTYTRPPVIINPQTKTITIGKGKKEWQISFGSVKGVSTSQPVSVLMSDAAIWKFTLNLDTGETIELGSISGDQRKLPERIDQITQLLTETLGLPVSH